MLGLSLDDFRALAVRWFLEQQLHAAGGRVAVLAKRIRRNRTDTYKLLRNLGVPYEAIQAEHGIKKYAQKPRFPSEQQALMQRWLLSSPFARRAASAIIADHGR